MATVTTVAAKQQDLEVYGGDDWVLTLKFWNGPASDNDPINISTYTIEMEVKEKALGDVKLRFSSAETDGGFTIVPGGQNNVMNISKKIELKGKDYVYDLQITYSDGTIQTYMFGKFTVIQDVTETEDEI